MKLNLPYLECPELTFSVANVAKTDENNYQWYGTTEKSEEEEQPGYNCTSGSLTIMKNEGLVIGHLTLDNRSFELYDLGDGVQAFCETDLTLFTAEECASTMEGETGIEYRTTTGDPCAPAITKVLVLYTPAALNYETDITGKAHLAISQLNNIWANSSIDNSLSIASIQPLSFAESSTGDIEFDINRLSNSSVAQALRATHKADIVVLLTAPSYSSVNGIVKNIGGTAAEAYTIVTVTSATTGRYTFAHEFTHLFGGRHDKDPEPGDAHGRIFTTGGFLGFFGTARHTLMAVLGSGSRIEHVSNPDIKFKNKPTGVAGTSNNAKTVNNLKYHVAGFYTEPQLTYHVTTEVYFTNTCRSEGMVIATGMCGQAPYQYQWYSSEDGFNWTAGGTGSGESFSVPAPPPNVRRKVYFMKVVVTDAGNNSITLNQNIRFICNRDDPNQRLQTALPVEKDAETRIFPIPNSGKFTVQLPESAPAISRVVLKDLSGKTVANLYEGSIHENKRALNLQTNQEHLWGLYLLQIESGNKVEYRKIILE